MKRHPALIPLSHDHRAALFTAQLIRRGVARYRDAPATAEAKLTCALEFYQAQWREHARFEETILFPALAGIDGEIDRLLGELAAEHSQIAASFAALAKARNLDAQLDGLSHLLETHIRKEERQLFERVQAILAADSLTKLGAQVAAYRAANPACGLPERRE